MGATNTDNLNAPKPISTNQLDTDVERIRTAFDAFDTAIAARATATALAEHVADPTAHSLSGLMPSSIGALADAPGSVSDSNIGNRTATPDSAPSGNTGTITALLSGLANRIRAIMGSANWWDAPPVSLTGAQAHIGSTSNPHGTTAAQVGAIPAAANQVTDTHLGSRTVNQSLANPGSTGTLTQLLSWLAGRIQAITGTTNWYDAPATTLAGAASHHANTGNPHGTTAAQVATASGYGSGAWGISISGNAATATSAAACSGNAATATKLATARTINGVSFDGTQNITIAMIKSIQKGISSGIANRTVTLTTAVNVNKSIVVVSCASGRTEISVVGDGFQNVAISVTDGAYLLNENTLQIVAGARGPNSIATTVYWQVIEYV